MNAAKWKKALLEATRGGTYINPDEAKELAELLQPEPRLGEAVNRGNMISIIQGAPYLVEINGGGWGFGYWSEKRGYLHCIHPRGHSFVRQNENVFAIDEKWLPPLPALPPEPSLEEQLEDALERVLNDNKTAEVIGALRTIPQIAALIGGSDE